MSLKPTLEGTAEPVEVDETKVGSYETEVVPAASQMGRVSQTVED